MNVGQRDPRTYQIIGAAMEVHKELGCGFLENVYQEALAIEFRKQNIPFQKEVDLKIRYKDEILNATYRADFICFDYTVLVELKALSAMSGKEESQIINYLKATKIDTGLLINFGSEALEHRRYVNHSN